MSAPAPLSIAGRRPSVADDAPRSEDRAIERVKTAAAVVAVVAMMAKTTLHAIQPLANADTWFHLRLGQEFASGSWSLWHPGSTSSFATSHWLPTQWSTEVVAAKMEDWFGLPGVAFFFGLLFVAFVLAVWFICRREGQPLPAALATGLVFVACSDELSARPQVVSLILLAVTVGAWRRSQADLRPRWWLVPLTWVWATAHGMWTAGVILGLACVVGLLLDHPERRREVLRLALVPLLSFAAALVTPVGPGLVVTQFAVSARSSVITEWAPTSFRTPMAFAAAVMVGLVLMLWARRTQVSWASIAMLAVASGCILLVQRTVGIGAVVAAPMMVAALDEVMPRRAESARGRRIETRVVLGAAAVMVVLMGVLAPHSANRPAAVPSRLTPRLAALPAGTVIYVDPPTGSWLTWRFPRLDPVVDGMFDAYPVSYLNGWMNAASLAPGWQGYVRRTGATEAVLPRNYPLASAMRDQLGWHQVAVDRQWVYLRR